MVRFVAMSLIVADAHAASQWGRDHGMRMRAACLAGFALVAAVVACGPAPLHVVSEDPVAPPPWGTAPEPSQPPPSAPGPPVASAVDAFLVEAAIVLEAPPCRNGGAAYRVSIAEDGGMVMQDLRRLDDVHPSAGAGVRRDQVDPAAVRALVDRALAAGVASWGHGSCVSSETERCSMHPCTVRLTVRRDGVTHVASASDVGSWPPAVKFGLAVADVQSLVRSWRWDDPAVPVAWAGPCEAAADCELRSDRCGRLHAWPRTAPTSLDFSGDCSRSASPRRGATATCVDGRCALAPVDPPGAAER